MVCRRRHLRSAARTVVGPADWTPGLRQAPASCAYAGRRLSKELIEEAGGSRPVRRASRIYADAAAPTREECARGNQREDAGGENAVDGEVKSADLPGRVSAGSPRRRGAAATTSTERLRSALCATVGLAFEPACRRRQLLHRGREAARRTGRPTDWPAGRCRDGRSHAGAIAAYGSD